jgi:hypothetical protein
MAPIEHRELSNSTISTISTTSTTSQEPSPLLALPPELVLHLTQHLPYPDLLALRLTHPTFYHSPLFATSGRRYIPLKVSWLIDRKSRGLSYPTKGSLDFISDEGFVRNGEVKGILRARRRHEECGRDGKEGKGHQCEVIVGERCNGPVGREGKLTMGMGNGGLGEWFVQKMSKLSWETVLGVAVLLVGIVYGLVNVTTSSHTSFATFGPWSHATVNS